MDDGRNFQKNKWRAYENRAARSGLLGEYIPAI